MLAELRGDYARVLPGRMSHIESLWREFSASGSRGDELIRAVHSIAGGAATFGMPEVGEAAEELEVALRAGEDKARIAGAVAQLLAASRAALART